MVFRYVNMHGCIFFPCSFMHLRAYPATYVRVYLPTYVHTYIHTYEHIYIYIYMPTCTDK